MDTIEMDTIEMDDLKIKLIKTASLDDLFLLYTEAGWLSPEDSSEYLDRIVADSAVFAGAFLNKRMIGMGRALSDMTSDAYIQDVAVLKEFQGRGIGKKIIQILIAELQKNGVDWIGLIAQPGTAGFYKNLGFHVLEGHVPLKLKDKE